MVVGTYGQAAAVVRAVTDAGLTVPGDVSVVAFDGDTRNSYGQIVLSTVQQHVDLMAATALDLALGLRPEPDEPPPPFEAFPAAGDSCGCATGPMLEPKQLGQPRTEAGTGVGDRPYARREPCNGISRARGNHGEASA